MAHNLVGRQAAQLETFSGTVTLAGADNLPEGASPRTQNMDYSVGSALTRQGLENPFTYSGESAGPSPGHSSANVIEGGPPWVNPGNVLLNTGVYATNTLPRTETLDIVSVGLTFTGPRSPGVLTVTFTAGTTDGPPYTFAGLTSFTGLNGETLTPVSVDGDTATFLYGFGIPAYGPAGDTGTATFAVTEETDPIDITQFSFSIPSGKTPQGFAVKVIAYASAPSTLTVQMLKAGIPVGVTRSLSLNVGSPTTLPFGGINDLFGASWVYSDLNNTTFGVRIYASSAVTSFLYMGYVTLTAYYLSSQENFNYVTTFEDNFGNIRTLAMDAAGDWFIANVNTDPWSLSGLFSGPPPGSFASSFTADSRQFISLSDLSQGNYPPLGYNNQWRDRISQVGPGAPPAFTGTLVSGNVAPITAYSASAGILTLTAANNFTAGEVVVILAGGGDDLAPLNGMRFNVLGTSLSITQFEIATVLVTGSGTSAATATGQYTYPIVASPNGIKQYAVQPAAQPGFFDCVLQSSGPGATNAGNTITIYYLNAFTHAVGDANLIAAVTNQKFPVYVYVSGVSIAAANGTQLVTSIGIATPPGGGDQRYFFTFNVVSSAYEKLGSGSASVPGAYQQTVATVKTTLPLPGVQVGDDLTISGDPVTPWDETWQIVNALNSGSYSVSQTSMTSGVATYNWALSGATSTPPVTGELVTVTGCLNGNGVFNVTDAAIATVTGTSSGTFTIAGFANQSFSTQIEVAQAVTSGTQFQIDPGTLTLGNAGQNPIYGNSGGGYVTLVGSSSVVVGTGTRRGVVFFIDRNGYWTKPSPFSQFTVTDNTNYLLASNIPIGPPNVIARGIAFTEAGQFGQPGASYYTIESPVSFVYNGITYLSSSLIINDNTTTSAQFTFPDTVLLSATEIDVQGNDLFNLGELGDSAWCVQYAGRSVFGRVRNKIQNFVNLSFDGGYNPNPGANLLPLGWGLNASTAPQASLPTLLTSPVFGQSYYIKNLTGSTASQLGMLTQTAYQDQNAVAILQNQTAYSVRVTCRTPSSALVGSLVIDLTDFNAGSGYGQTYGSFTLALSAMTSNMVTYEGTLLTDVFPSVPPGLLLRLWASGLANNGDVEIDRVEIFPTQAPTNLTGLTISYKNDWESFDRITGGTDTNTVNAQPANGAFEMNGLLYILKESSLGYIADTPNQEPANWNPYKEVSNVAGACGINAYDVGKKWAITACQNGLFLFNGGEPIPIQLEVPDIWQAIKWSHAQSICARNDTANNRIMVACPMVTPNQWCPDFPANDGTTGNNVILYVNYDGIGSIEELMSAESMHMTIMGKLAVHDMKRKWSLWSIPCPYMALCKTSELESQLLIGNGVASSKIYVLGAYESGQDDGADFTSSYCTYGFVDADVAKENPIFGLNNKRYVYYDLLISGNASINAGNMSVTFFQNSLSAPYPFVVPGGIDLEDPQTNNIEGPLDEFAQRLFVEIKVTGKYFNLSHIGLVAQADSWSPIRGF